MDKKMIEATEITYHDAGYVAAKIGVKPNTLRKYASIIEEILNNKHRFRHDNAMRTYSDSDIELLKKALQMRDETGITLKKALKTVFFDHDLVVNDAAVMPNVMVDRDTVKQLIHQNEELKAQNAEIVKQNEELKLKIDEVLARLPADVEVDQPNKSSKRSLWDRLIGRD